MPPREQYDIYACASTGAEHRVATSAEQVEPQRWATPRSGAEARQEGRGGDRDRSAGGGGGGGGGGGEGEEEGEEEEAAIGAAGATAIAAAGATGVVAATSGVPGRRRSAAVVARVGRSQHQRRGRRLSRRPAPPALRNEGGR